MNIAIITGASSGLGREFALKLNKGYKDINEFWLVARRENRLKRLAKLLNKRARIFILDLEREDSVKLIEKTLLKVKPNIKYLVNAAGFGLIAEVGKYSAYEEARMIDLNVKALTMLTNICLPYTKRGSEIFMLASAAAFMPQPGFAVYAATKAYVLSYSSALRQEQEKRGVRVLAVCTGPVATEFFDKAEKKYSTKLYKKLFMAEAKAVVSKAIVDAGLKKGISVYSLGMKLFRISAKLMPQSLLLKILNKLRQ